MTREEKIICNKNDLGVDAVSRKAVINQIFYSTDNNGDVVLGSALRERIAGLSPVTPQADTPFTDTEEAEKKAYNIGLNDAWAHPTDT